MKRYALPFLAFFFGAFLIYPLVGLLDGAFLLADTDGHRHFTLSFFQLLIENRLYRISFLNSLEIALLSTVCTALVSIPLAVLFSRYRFPGREWLRPLLLAPLILPPFVGALGIKHIFARFGVVNLLLAKIGFISLAHPIDWLGASGFTGIVILEVLHLFPIFFLSTSAALANIDPSLLDAAANLGASAWRRFVTITLPLARPGIFGAACLVFISAFTDLGTPLILNYTATVPTQIFNAAADANSEQIGYAFVVATLVLVMVFFLLRPPLWRKRCQCHARARRPTVPPMQTLPPAAGWARHARPSPRFSSSPILPHIGVVVTSFAERWFFTILPDENLRAILCRSLQQRPHRRRASPTRFSTPVSARFVDLALGLVIAHLLARAVFPGKSLLDALAMLPLALPGLVLAFGLLMSYNWHGAWAWINPRNEPHVSPRHQLRPAPPALHRARRVCRLSADQHHARGGLVQSWARAAGVRSRASRCRSSRRALSRARS